MMMQPMPMVADEEDSDDDEAFEEGRQKLSLALLVCDPILVI